MTVEMLQNVLQNLNPDAEVFIEYVPRAHQYVTEYALGVRATDEEVVIFGHTEMLD